MEETENLGVPKNELFKIKNRKKLETILLKLLEPDLEIKNDIYLNLLLTHWINKAEDGIATVYFDQGLSELFFQWLTTASNLWDKKRVTPSTPVLLFALHICCHLSIDEIFFQRMSTENVFQKLADISQLNQGLDASVTVGFITLLSSVLEYAVGVEWLLTTTYWNYVINMALKDRSKYIKKKAYQFVIKLLETTVLLDQEFCEELVEILVEPFSEAATHAELIKDSKAESMKMYDSLKPSLDLISEVADALLKNFSKNVLNLFLETEVPEAIQNILNSCQIQEFSFDLLKIRFAFLFYQLCVKMEGIQQVTYDEDTLVYIRIMFDLIKAEIEKDHVSGVIKICHYAHVLYCSLDTRIPLCIRKGESIEFQNQMMLFQLVPIMAFSNQLLGTQKNKELLRTDDLRRDFYLKFAKISAIKTLEITSRWQERLTRRPELVDDVSLSCQFILKSKKIINKEQAAFIFRPLIYAINDIILRMERFRTEEMKPRGIKFINLITNTIIDLVESFDITWKDSIETISVLDLVCDIVKYEYVNYQITVKFLQLLNMAITRCMSPNMVLLMDNTNDSVISQIGNVLYTKCHENNYHIRNAGLEVVHTLALNAIAKFPEFTNVLFNAELPQLVVKMALNDKEHVVRATATKCIQALIRVEDIWEVYQSDRKFWDKILNILVSEPKSTVRKEAAILIYDIYNLYSFPEDVLPRLYDIMTHAAIGDIHWEVKCNALRFWTCTLKNLLRAQGMIDRGFPTHTFSKEKKKIITLTEAEIQKRVIKVLNQLSEIGCLYVFKTALQDEFDEEVSKAAMSTAKDMVKMFKHHKITCENVDLNQRPLSPASSSTKSSFISSASASDGQFSPDRRFSLESLPFQYPDSPYSVDLNFSPAPGTPEDITLKSPEDAAPLTHNTQKNRSADNIYFSVNNQKTGNGNDGICTNEVEKFDLLNVACTEKELLMLENDIDMGLVLSENETENLICPEMAETEKMFDELLKLNDATLLEEICNPGYKVNSTPKLQTKVYILPSEFIRFCNEIFKSNDRKAVKVTQVVDEFDLLLDDILKECHATTLEQS